MKQKHATQSKKSVGSRAASTIYKDFAIWESTKTPSWHPVKKMRYVFFRMIGGRTVTDALTEIHWNASEFWHLVDLKRNAPFRLEYKRAKTLQGRAFGDAVAIIADGRDAVTRAREAKLEALIKRAMHRAVKGKSTGTKQLILDSMITQLQANDSAIIARNKLQIDAAKWIAKTSAPQEYTEQTKVAIGSPDATTGDIARHISIQFVNPDGTVASV